MSIPDWEVDGTMERAQRDALLLALSEQGYRVSRAAARLRIGRSTAYRLIKRYGISIPDDPRSRVSPAVASEKQALPRAGSAGGSEVVFDGKNFLLVKR